MVDVNVEFVLGQEEPIDAEFILQPDVTYTAEIVLNASTVFHDELYHLDYPDQHPIGAIIGLSEELSNLSDEIDAEKERAEYAENILNGKIDDEISRAILAEGGLSDRITNETTRATERENELASSIESNHQAISNHVSNKNNPHEVTKSQVGLGNVDNTSDVDKPVSTAQQSALDGKVDKVSTADRVYGTNSSGNQTTYDINSFGKVDDVRVGGNSVVTNKIANLGTMAGENSSNYYTSSEIDVALNNKQDTIADLSNIRSDSQDGKTAYDIIQTYGDIVTHDVDEFATAAQGILANTALQPNDNISELTNDVGYITASSLPTVNDGTLTVQKNGTQIATFTANQSGNTTANIIVPTTTSELTNNSDFQTGTQVANSIATETNNREIADNNLQSQIDAIVSSSDVYDIVGTYAELQAYNISTVPVNDIIKVLVDETHSGAATYYRCVETGGVKSWLYIGSEGAYYTKAEADSIFVPQTRTINSKALSNNITLTANDVGALPSSTVIPTVNDATLTIQKNNTTINSFTANSSTDTTINIEVPTDTSDLTNGAGFITGIDSSDVTTALGYTPLQSSDISNMVTTNTAQNISAKKTFLGEKAILFKQTATTDKLGFTLYTSADSELGALEYRPNTISGNPLLNLNSSQSGNVWLGFRYWSNINIIAPKPSNGNYYIPVNITNGTNTVTANNAGTVNISTLLPTKTSDLTNDSGYITGISSSDVTIALGYTPYNSSNPDGYTSNVGTVTSVNNTSPDANGNVAISIPAAQVNSDWNANSGVAEILNKPTLATVATSGSYNDLTDKPTIPTKMNMTYTAETETLTWWG